MKAKFEDKSIFFDNCKLCKSERSSKLFLTIEDDNNKVYRWFECDICGAVFIDPFEITKYESIVSSDYNWLYFRYLSEFEVDYFLTVYPLFMIRKFILNKKRSLGRKIRFLDIGSGSGVMIMYAKYLFDMEVYGVEPAPYANFAGDILGCEIHNGYLESFEPEQKFDIVFLSQVIEHVPEPVSFLSKVKDLMEDDGLLIMLTPHSEVSKTDENSELFWRALAIPRHLILYNEKSMDYLLNIFGFKHRIFFRDFIKDIGVFASKLDINLDVSNYILKDTEVADRLFIKLSMELMDKIKENLSIKNNPYYTGLGYRVFKYLINMGNYELAYKFIKENNFLHVEEYNLEEKIEEIKTYLDFGKMFEFCKPGLLYYYGFLNMVYLKDYKKAIDLFEQSQKTSYIYLRNKILNPEAVNINYLSMLNKSICYIQIGDTEKAVITLNKILRIKEEIKEEDRFFFEPSKYVLQESRRLLDILTKT